MVYETNVWKDVFHIITFMFCIFGLSESLEFDKTKNILISKDGGLALFTCIAAD